MNSHDSPILSLVRTAKNDFNENYELFGVQRNKIKLNDNTYIQTHCCLTDRCMHINETFENQTNKKETTKVK